MKRAPRDARRKILDASVALVAEQGVRAVSFREVARRAGVSHQTPYHHFGDHLGILREIAREGFAGLTEAMQSAARRFAGDPLRALHAAGVAYVSFARRNVGHFRVMFQGNQEPLPEAMRTYETLVRLAADVHRSGAARGVSVETLSHLAWSAVHGLSILLIEGTLQAKQRVGDDETAVRRVLGALRLLLDQAG